MSAGGSATAFRATGDRDQMVDVLRGLCMASVILGHSLEMFFSDRFGSNISPEYWSFFIWKVIYSFHMPAFLFISGAALSLSTPKSMMDVIRASLHLFLLAAASQLFLFPLIYVFGGHKLDINHGFLYHWVHPVLTGKGYIIVIPWFFIALSGSRIFLFLAKSLHAPWSLAFVCLVFCVSILFDYMQYYYFQIHIIFISSLFVFLGTKYCLIVRVYPMTVLVTLVSLLLALAVVVFAAYANRGCPLSFSTLCSNQAEFGEFAVMMSAGSFGFFPAFIVSSLGGIACIWLLSDLVLRSPARRAFAYIGRQSIVLVFINGTFLASVEPGLSAMRPQTLGAGLVFLGATVLLQVAVVPIAAPAVELMNAWCRRVESFIVDRLFFRLKVQTRDR